MKKIFFFGLTLNLFLSIITQNYCFSHPFLNSDYYYRGDINSSLRLPNRLDAVESSKEKSNYSVLEKPALHAGLLIVDHSLSLLGFLNEFDDFDKVHLISKSENLSKLSNFEFKNDQGDFVLGEKITLTAEPNPGFKFVNWTVDGKVVSEDLTYTLIVPSKNISIKANFEKVSEVTPDPGSGTSLLEGLVAFYEMNTNLSGVLKDSHGQNNGTSTQISQVNGYNENGNRYDGRSSVSSVPHSNSLNLSTEFTLMADIFRQGNGQASSSIILGKTFSAAWTGNQTYSMAITKDNKIRIRTNSPDLKDWVSTQTVPLGKWIRVIATYKSGEGYRLFMDTTEPEKSPQFSGTIAKSDLELTIGSASLTNNAAYNRRFEGILDNVGMWSRQLSKDEIARLITTKITYPDFKGNETYRITMSTSKEETIGKITTTSDLTKAEVGEKIIFLAENEENMVFDHWSLDGVEVGNQTLFELDMPKKDISLTKHFRTLVGPEIRIRLPSEKSDFEAMSEVHIEFEIKSNDATIEKVELFNGNELVAELTQDFSGIDWKNIPEGNHELVARITDTNSQSYFSEAVILKVVDNQAKDTPNVLLEYIIGPNPTLEYLNVIFTNLDGIYDFEFRVVSMNGVVEKSFRARPEDSAVTIDVSDLDMGVYVLHLIGNGHNLSSRKFIKE
jgi:hypothetical protein